MKRDPLPEAVQAEFDAVKKRLLERAAAQEAAERSRRPDEHISTSGRGGSCPADPIATATIVERLVRKFGLGDRPDCRRKFYGRIAEMASKYGQQVLDLVSVAAAQASSARQPGRYFCACVKVLAAERGLSFEPEAPREASW